MIAAEGHSYIPGTIPRSDFDRGVAVLHSWAQTLSRGSEWAHAQVVTFYEEVGLRLNLHRHNVQVIGENITSPEIDEDDDAERMDKSPAIPLSKWTFDVMYSPTYQVPVLYSYRSERIPSSPTADSSNATEHEGVISITDHPWYGFPARFVHPCRTADAMYIIRGEDGCLTPAQYLIAWLGIVGAPLGLSVPVELAQHLAADSSE